MAHKIRMVTEIATKDFIKWMKFWLNIPNYVGSKAREGKLEKAEATLSRAKIEKGSQKVKKDLFVLSCFLFTKQRHLKKFASGTFCLLIYTYSTESMILMLGKMWLLCYP